jgi:hypothetical protein
MLAPQGLDRPGEVIEVLTAQWSTSTRLTHVRRALWFPETKQIKSSGGMFSTPSTGATVAERAAVERVLEGPVTIPVVPVEIPAA